MFRNSLASLALAATLALGGCSFVNDAVWPSLSGEPPAPPDRTGDTGPGTDEAPPPEPTAESPAEIAGALDRIGDAIAPLQARLPLTAERLSVLEGELTTQARVVTDVTPAGTEDPGETWATLQIELSRLNDELDRLKILRGEVAADAAAAAQQIAALEQVGRTRIIGAKEGPENTVAELNARYERIRAQLGALLADIGRQDAAVGAAIDRWDDLSVREAARLETLRPPPTPVTPSAPKPVPSTPETATDQPSAPTGPRESGDRFKGRQPLATLKFADPDLAFEDQLRGLLTRVKEQYPDVQFDVESVGASDDAMARVQALLREQDIPADTYITPLEEGAVPEVRLYPR